MHTVSFLLSVVLVIIGQLLLVYTLHARTPATPPTTPPAKAPSKASRRSLEADERAPDGVEDPLSVDVRPSTTGAAGLVFGWCR